MQSGDRVKYIVERCDDACNLGYKPEDVLLGTVTGTSELGVDVKWDDERLGEDIQMPEEMLTPEEEPEEWYDRPF